MNKQQLKQLIKECLYEISSNDLKIGDRVEFTETGTIVNKAMSNNIMIKMDNEQLISVNIIDNKVKKLEF